MRARLFFSTSLTAEQQQAFAASLQTAVKFLTAVIVDEDHGIRLENGFVQCTVSGLPDQVDYCFELMKEIGEFILSRIGVPVSKIVIMDDRNFSNSLRFNLSRGKPARLETLVAA